MTNIRLTTALFAAVIGMVTVVPRAKADEWNKRTIVTTSAPLNVAGTVLEPGKYVFQLLNTAPYSHVVQIMNARENHVYTTVIAHPVGYMEQGVPADLQGPQAGKGHFTFWETTAGEPRALRDWYYPGSFQGEEFPYHKIVTQISQVTTQETPAPPPPAPVAEAPAPAPPPAEIAQNTPPPPPAETPAPAPAPEATPAPAPAPATIPQTASNIPFLALLGFSSIALALGLSAFAKRMG